MPYKYTLRTVTTVGVCTFVISRMADLDRLEQNSKEEVPLMLCCFFRLSFPPTYSWEDPACLALAYIGPKVYIV